MNSSSKILISKRRGLSSVVGALLFVVLMVSTFAVLGVALDSQTDIVSTSRDVSDLDLKKQQEKFTATIFADSDEVLTVNVENSGQNPVEIFTLVMTNSTDTFVHEISPEYAFVAPLKKENVVAEPEIKLTLASSGFEIYDFKVISSLGNIKTGSIVCSTTSCEVLAGDGSLRASLFLDGPNAINTKNTTAVMFVTNTSDEPLTNVKPTKGWPTPGPICDDLWEFDNSTAIENIVIEDVVNCVVTPASEITLGPRETSIFKWDGEIRGDIGTQFEFCSGATGDDSGGPVDPIPESCDIVTVINPNDCGGCGEGGGEGGETIILIDDLLIRPSIFMVIPSPFGDTQDNQDDRGVWGINVANPTDQELKVSKITIVAYPPGGNSQDTVFNGYQSASPCLAEDIHPGELTNPFNIGPDTFYAGDWTCPRDNILMWQNFTNPISVAANSTQSFMVKVEPSIIKSGDNIDALIVQANVYSTFGSFGKAAYQSSMYEEKSPIVNVYMSNSIGSRTDIIGNIDDITENSTNIFNISIADMDDQPDTIVKADAKLIINVPREWTFNNLVSCDGFDDNDGDGDCNDANKPSVTVHSDGSTQIIGVTKQVLGDGTNDVRTISFNATAPDVNYPRLYVMYLLADGIVDTPTGGEKTIGPLNEVVLNVDP